MRSEVEEPNRVSGAGPAAVIVLAAGEGTRMKSPIPKTLHQVCGQTMLGHCLAAAAELSPDRLIVVVGHDGDLVAAHARQQVTGAVIVVQYYLSGTRHAVIVLIGTIRIIVR